MMLWVVPEALAHRPGLSYARVDPDALVLTFAKPELATRLPVEDLEASRLLIAELTVGRARVTLDGTPCTLEEPSVREVEGDGVEIRSPMTCDGEGEGVYHADFLPEFEVGHRHVLGVGDATVAVLDASAPTAAFTAEPSTAAVASRWVGLGLEHIWTGYDHLLFLVGLLLAAPGLRAMLFIVTGFTVAHSITLTAAALGLFTLPPSFVEPAIAASIAWVGIENFWRPSARRRVVITFLLGLIHGFGFAGMLAELGLPRRGLAMALVSFNGGVELGQAAVVAVVLPMLLLLRRTTWWEARAVPAGSVGVAAAGMYWLVTRVMG